MTRLSKREKVVEDAALTLGRLVRVLARRCESSDEELVAKAAMGLAAWANERKPAGLRLAPIGATPLWRQPKQFTHLAVRHSISDLHLTAASFRLGRAVALLDGGYSLTRVADLGGWSSPLKLAWALDVGLSARPSARRGAEPLRPRWPLPGAAPALPRRCSWNCGWSTPHRRRLSCPAKTQPPVAQLRHPPAKLPSSSSCMPRL